MFPPLAEINARRFCHVFAGVAKLGFERGWPTAKFDRQHTIFSIERKSRRQPKRKPICVNGLLPTAHGRELMIGKDIQFHRHLQPPEIQPSAMRQPITCCTQTRRIIFSRYTADDI
jgi:hypothetical protein